MALSPNFKVVSVDHHHHYKGENLERYKSVNVASVQDSPRAPNLRYTLFTQESATPGDLLYIHPEELTPVLGQTTMFVYRPESALSPFFNIVSRLPSEGVGLPEDALYLTQRAAKKGYDPVHSKILSAMDFSAGDQMQASMVNLYTTGRDGEKLYRHDDKKYQEVLWRSLQVFCR